MDGTNITIMLGSIIDPIIAMSDRMLTFIIIGGGIFYL